MPQGWTPGPAPDTSAWTSGSTSPPVSAGSERTRTDTTAVGVNHEWIVQKWADFATKHLPKQYAPLAAAVGTFISDIPASAVEMLSSPESIATMGAGGVSKFPAAADRYPGTSVAEQLNALGRGLGRVPEAGVKTKIAAELLQKIQPRMAAGYDRYLPNVSGVEAKTAPAAVAAATETAGPVPGVPPASPSRSPAIAQGPQAGVVPVVAAKKPVLTLEEYQAAEKLMKEGYSVADVLRAIERNRLPEAFRKLPSDAEVAAEIANRGPGNRSPRNRP